MIRVICTDLDGTLLHSDKTVSGYSLKMLEKMIKSGIEVIPVTGRHLGGIPKEILSLDINYAICANGASLYDVKKKRLIKAEFIEKDILLEMVSLCEKYEVMSDIFSGDYAYTDNRCIEILKDVNASEAVKNYIKQSRKKIDSIKKFIEEKNPDVQKITMNFRYLNGEYKNREKMAETLKKYDMLTAVTGGANNIEVTSSKATKGNCMRYISKMLGISLEDFFAIGDTENDISMLETAGQSCAMKNADENVKKICKYVTEEDNDSDGAVKMMIKIAGVS